MFAYLEKLRIESVLKEQRDIFIYLYESLHESEIEEFMEKKHCTLQETEAFFHQFQVEFQKWFIETYIIPKYFP